MNLICFLLNFKLIKLFFTSGLLTGEPCVFVRDIIEINSKLEIRFDIFLGGCSCLEAVRKTPVLLDFAPLFRQWSKHGVV